MDIVFEGPDGSGKSTLARHVCDTLALTLIPGAGPPREPGEIERRLAKYLTITNAVYDRHPAISQPIYGALRGETSSDEFIDLVSQFYYHKPLLVYCRATDLRRHVVKPGENPEHIAIVERRHRDLLELYDAWAFEHAHVIYRIGDDVDAIVEIVRAVMAS